MLLRVNHIEQIVSNNSVKQVNVMAYITAGTGFCLCNCPLMFSAQTVKRFLCIQAKYHCRVWLQFRFMNDMHDV